MRDSLRILCNDFIDNRDIIKSTFGWESSYLYPVCAAIFTDKGKKASKDKLLYCRDILKAHTGVFSTFRSTSKLAMISLMAVAEDPEQKLKNALEVYSLLKEHFWSSDYLPMASMVITDIAKPEEYHEVAARTRMVYNLMKDEHPFLTSGEDCVFAALLALSDMSCEQLVNETERCYQILKPEFFSGNAVQSLSHVLALCEGSSESKCQRTIQLFRGLKEKGFKYSILGVGKKQRLMHAGMLVVSDYMEADNHLAMNSAAIGSTISLIIAQEAALCAAMAASAAASAASSN